jgi:hypothetical protein
MRERGARSVLIRALRLDFRTSCRCRHLIDTPPTPGVRIGADFFDRTKAGLKKSLLMRHDGIGRVVHGTGRARSRCDAADKNGQDVAGRTQSTAIKATIHLWCRHRLQLR